MLAHKESLTFPFTPTHNGIATILAVRGDGSTGFVQRVIGITEDGSSYQMISAVFAGAWQGASFSFPVRAGHTYAISEGSGYVSSDSRTFFTW